MAAVQFINFFQTELSSPVAPTDLSIEVSSITDADGFSLASLITGGNWIYLTLVDANSIINNLVPPQTHEIVKVTAITGTGPYTLTVVRAQDHTSAESFSRCDYAIYLINAQSLYDITSGGGSGTVTEIDTALPITGGPITTTGTIGVNTMTGDSGSGGLRGVVPAPGSGDAAAGKFLKADATWAVPPGGSSVSITASLPATATPSPITGTGVIGVNVMTGDSGSGGAKGAVPAPSAGDAAAGKFLKADATWAVPPGGSGGTLQGQAFTSSGTFNVPTGVTSVWVTEIGGGGGGSSTISAAAGGGGGGAGELVQNLPAACTSGGTITVTIGAGGAGGAAGQSGAQTGSNGGDTSIVANSITYVARGGYGAAASSTSGAGGGVNGAAAVSGGAVGLVGAGEAPTYFGGSSGGAGGTTTGSNGLIGGGSGGYIGGAGGSTASTQAGGGGGASTIWGVGGVGGNGGVIGGNAPATSYGSGGGGGGAHATTTIGGGNGCAGYVLIQWIS